MGRLVVGISGASGIKLAHRLISALTCEVDLVITSSALYTAAEEMGREYATVKRFVASLPRDVKVHGVNDMGAGIASGSYPTDGMVIIPCSMTTVAAIAMGLGDNCLRRAADVTLKEKRPLVIVPRETPLSEIHLENLLKLAKRGTSIVSPVPAWYTKPQTLEDIENFIVGKVLDALHIKHSLYPRWKVEEELSLATSY
ncbi:MAG: putative UbiX-like flavin prenyltransferase [Chlamydiales bacterium]|nr:putative UbiX-like flavin prenyltransferase [Chlamydiales bacterium]MCH9620314.1 putative UbiX-like flavin prenyltransferase [Chlamydiales bacterium]MCH9622775.1 putative UbiX-like flavin prenyltransferase [Chlamydiales bacterium]